MIFKFIHRSEIKSKLNDLIDALKANLASSSAKQLKRLTAHDFTLLEKYEEVFEPVARALDILQGETNNSQGYIIPVLQSMKMRILAIEEANNIVRDFKDTLLKQVDNRFGPRGISLKRYIEICEKSIDMLHSNKFSGIFDICLDV